MVLHCQRDVFCPSCTEFTPCSTSPSMPLRPSSFFDTGRCLSVSSSEGRTAAKLHRSMRKTAATSQSPLPGRSAPPLCLHSLVEASASPYPLAPGTLTKARTVQTIEPSCRYRSLDAQGHRLVNCCKNARLLNKSLLRSFHYNIILRINCYSITLLHYYMSAFLHSYTLTFLHSYILTFLHSYILTFLHSYILTFLHSYILTFLHSYIPTLHYYILTLLHAYIVLVVHYDIMAL